MEDAKLPASTIEYLRKAMLSRTAEGGETQYGYEAWLGDVFA